MELVILNIGFCIECLLRFGVSFVATPASRTVLFLTFKMNGSASRPDEKGALYCIVFFEQMFQTSSDFGEVAEWSKASAC